MNKTIWIIVIVLLLIAIGIVAIRVFTPEDDWICQNGVWVKHGQPAATQPDSPCQ